MAAKKKDRPWFAANPNVLELGTVPVPALVSLPSLYFYAGAGGSLSMSGSDVNSWTDLSAGIIASQSGSRRPTYTASLAALNGKPAVRFNQDAFQNLVAASGALSASDADYTVISVLLPTYSHQAFGATPRTSRQYLIEPGNDVGAGDLERLILAYKANLSPARYGYFDEAGPSSGWNHGIHQSMNKAQVFCWDLKQGAASLHRNGVTLSSGLAYTRRPWENGLTLCSAVGQGPGSTDTYYDGYIAAFAVWVGGLSSGNRDTQISNFMTYYGIRSWCDAPLLIAPEIWHRTDMGFNVNELAAFDEWHNAGGISGTTSAFALRPGTGASPSAGERPGTTTIGGKTALTFDGVGQFMTGTQYTYQWSRGMTTTSRHGWAIARVNAVSTDAAAGSPHLNDHIFADSAGNYGVSLDATDGVQNYGFSGPAIAAQSLSELIGQLILIEWWHDGANLKIRVNNNAAVTGDALVTQAGTLAVSIHVGRRGSQTEYAQMDLIEWGMKQAYSAGNSTTLRTYVAQEYPAIGITP